MTSKLTRAQLHERARENVKALKMASRQKAFESAREEILADLQLAELALAAMDSEPVAWRWRSGPDKRWHLASRGDLAGEVEPLYRHAQPAPVVPEEATPTVSKFLPVPGVVTALYSSGMKTSEMRPLIPGTPAAPPCSQPPLSHPAVNPLPCRVNGFR